MSRADTIIALEDGKIVETGTPTALLQGDGYISKLGISTPVAGVATDVRRKNGQISVYKYYLASAGYIAVVGYVFFVVLWVFCLEFSSESAICYLTRSSSSNQNDSRLGHVVV